VDVAVLVVNAGSRTLKLHVVDGDESRPVDSFAQDVDAVAHRVVHGGPRFHEAVVVDDEVRAEIERLEPLAPLHNVHAVRALDEARRALPNVPHVAVFDTAFHATIPDVASTYAVPQRWREWGVRRYGFQGLSVQWCAEQVPVSRLVVCHLGGGSSVSAVRDGRSIDTTMGFTPLEGVPMTTRSGSVDPGLVVYLLREHGFTADELDHALNLESGLKALSGTSGDMREVETAGGLALDLYVYRVAAAVGAMAVALGGLDAIAFTGGVGENSATVRERICANLGFLEPFDVHVVEAREELVAARAAREVLA